ncbi:ATP-binding cassette domain-containing protein, partial [Paenibacillus polymyxa]|nr:ATP-binding cassette domain-containing protein [Paenibacillus polymyxa]
ERLARIHDIISAVGLNEYVLQRYPGELSGGMGQRVMIAIALINNPQVLIADEPTSALDARLRNQILERLDAASLMTDGDERRRALTFVVGGGGFAGVEAIAEMEGLIRDAVERDPRISQTEVR